MKAPERDAETSRRPLGGRGRSGHSQPNSPRSQLAYYPQRKSLSGILNQTTETRVFRGDCTREGLPAQRSHQTSSSHATESSSTKCRSLSAVGTPFYKKTISNPHPAAEARGPGPAPSQAQPRPLRLSPRQASDTHARPSRQAHKGYQHHGFNCFFFLRPITALYGPGRKEAKRSWKKQKEIADFSEPTATAASHRKQTQNGRHPRSLSTSRRPPRRELVRVT